MKNEYSIAKIAALVNALGATKKTLTDGNPYGPISSEVTIWTPDEIDTLKAEIIKLVKEE